MAEHKVSGEEFKNQLRAGQLKVGLFLNSGSPTVAAQLSHTGYDWLLIDTQHGPMDFLTLSAMITSVKVGKAKSMVRVGGFQDRSGIQQALDIGADGILVPYINNKQEVEEAVSCILYPTSGTRSVYYPQGSTNEHGLLGYVPNSNKNVIVAVQIETAASIENIDAILSVPGVDIAFLGQNDLCMSMGLFVKYEFPHMYTSKELNDATQKMLDTCAKYKKIAGIFLFGTGRVAEFVKKGFNFISVGNDLHHILTQAQTYFKGVEEGAKDSGKSWKPLPSNM